MALGTVGSGQLRCRRGARAGRERRRHDGRAARRQRGHNRQPPRRPLSYPGERPRCRRRCCACFRSGSACSTRCFPAGPDVLDGAGGRPAMAVHIALAHTSFNVLMAAIALPSLRSAARARDPSGRPIAARAAGAQVPAPEHGRIAGAGDRAMPARGAAHGRHRRRGVAPHPPALRRRQHAQTPSCATASSSASAPPTPCSTRSPCSCRASWRGR